MVDYKFVYVEIGLLVLFTFKTFSLQIADILGSMFKFSSILKLFYIFRVELSQPECFISTEWTRWESSKEKGVFYIAGIISRVTEWRNNLLVYIGSEKSSNLKKKKTKQNNNSNNNNQCTNMPIDTCWKILILILKGGLQYKEMNKLQINNRCRRVVVVHELCSSLSFAADLETDLQFHKDVGQVTSSQMIFNCWAFDNQSIHNQ